MKTTLTLIISCSILIFSSIVSGETIDKEKSWKVIDKISGRWYNSSTGNIEIHNEPENPPKSDPIPVLDIISFMAIALIILIYILNNKKYKKERLKL